jgi:hypothetical protein
MVHVGEEAIKPSPENVIGVSRLFGNVMVDVVGNHVHLLGDDLDDQVPADEKPETVRESEGVMSGITVKVNGSVGSQNHHAVNETDEEQFETEVFDEKQEEERREAKGGGPTEKGEPILAGFKQVQPGKKFPKHFFLSGDVEGVVFDEAVGGWVQDPV